jgi:hypothetical protein
MTPTSITVEATLQPDGVTLHLEKKLALSPGRIMVTLQTLVPKTGSTMLEVLDRIHRNQLGRKQICEEEMAAEITQMRSDDNEYEERWRNIWSQTATKTEKTDHP